MKQRSIVKLALLSLVTLSIYAAYWLYDTRRELTAKGLNVPPFLWLGLPYTLSIGGIIIALIINVIGVVTSDGFPIDGAVEHFMNFIAVEIIITGMLAVMIGAFWLYKYLQAAKIATDGQVNVAVSYILLIVLILFSSWCLWPAIIQDAFNNHGDDKADNTPGPPQPIVTA